MRRFLENENPKPPTLWKESPSFRKVTYFYTAMMFYASYMMVSGGGVLLKTQISNIIIVVAFLTAIPTARNFDKIGLSFERPFGCLFSYLIIVFIHYSALFIPLDVYTKVAGKNYDAVVSYGNKSRFSSAAGRYNISRSRDIKFQEFKTGVFSNFTINRHAFEGLDRSGYFILTGKESFFGRTLESLSRSTIIAKHPEKIDLYIKKFPHLVLSWKEYPHENY